MQRSIGSALALASALATTSTGERLASLVLLDTEAYPAARCLDGSPGAFYWLPASAPANDTKWIIRLEGGGECIDAEDCNSRAQGLDPPHSGSSTGYEPTEALNHLHEDDAALNPDFHSWNKVFVKYCSGDLHLGMQTVSGATLPGLQFSGHNIFAAVLDRLRDAPSGASLDTAEIVVISGESAGGRAAFAHLDFVLDSLPKSVHVVGAPIAGWGMSQNMSYTGLDPAPIEYKPWDYAALEAYFKLWSAYVPESCAAERPLTPWQCIFPDAFYATLRTPVFVMSAQTDQVVMPLHSGLPKVWESEGRCFSTVDDCPEEVLDFMYAWQADMAQSLQQLLDSGRGDGLFYPACLLHTNFTETAPLLGGQNYVEALGNWVFSRGAPTVLVDDCGDSVMCNPSCDHNWRYKCVDDQCVLDTTGNSTKDACTSSCGTYLV